MLETEPPFIKTTKGGLDARGQRVSHSKLSSSFQKTVGYEFNSFLKAYCSPFPHPPLLLFILIKIMDKYWPKHSILVHVFFMKKQ